MSSDTVPAAGSDVDSQKRDLKTRLAAAETAGDDKAVSALRGELNKVDAAAGRAAAAGDNPDAAKAAPSGRTSTPAKSTTAKSA